MASQHCAPLTASIFRAVIPSLFYRCRISAELSTISGSGFTGYAVSGSNFTFDFPVAFLQFRLITPNAAAVRVVRGPK